MRTRFRAALVAATVCSALFGLRGAEAAGIFWYPSSSSTSGQPDAHVMADVSQDGLLDAIIVSGTAGRMTVLRGSGYNSFGYATYTAIPAGTVAIAAGDLNHDGRTDVVTSTITGNTLTTWIGGLNGTFTAAATVSTPAYPSAIEVADFNGDGKPDVAVAGQSAGMVATYPGTGTGGLGIATTTFVGGNPNGLAAADLDGNGVTDLAVSNFNATTYALIGNGAGGFASQAIGGNLTGGGRSVKVADLNADGLKDVVISTSGGAIESFTHSGTSYTRNVRAFGGSGRGIALGDVDVDGKIDAVMYEASQASAVVFLGAGDGTFASGVAYSSNRSGHSNDFATISLVDADGDGVMDMQATGYSGYELTYWLNLVAPSTPTNLTAVPGPWGAGLITLSWQRPAGNIFSYRIYRGTASGSLSQIAEIGGGGSAEYYDYGLANGTTYFYTVTAANDGGESPPSNEASATTFDVPSAPLNLMATAGPGNGAISLTWDTPANDGGTPISYYRLYRSETSGGPEQQLAAYVTERTFTDGGLGNATTYYYRVEAWNLVGSGARSNEASATTFGPPSAPRNLTAEPGTALGEVKLSWTPPASDGGRPVLRYVVCRGTTSGVDVWCATLGAQTTYSDGGLLPLTGYYYVVYAENELGRSPASNEECTRAFPWIAVLGC